MSAEEKRCACGGAPYKHSPRIEAIREATWRRAVETGRKRADEEMSTLCAACIWKRIADGVNARHDVNALGGSA